MLNILNIEPNGFSINALKLIKSKRWNYFTLNDDVSLCTIDVLIIRLSAYINSEFLMKYKNLKYIISPTTGTDHIDIDLLNKKVIKLICLKGENKFLKKITSTAELHWGLLVSLSRNILPANEHVVNDKKWLRDNFKGVQLSEKEIGIIGLGRLGTIIAEYATAFNMNVSYFDPFVNETNYNKYQKLDSLLRNSDFISINVPLNKSTEKMISSDNKGIIKQGSFIINTSRGKIVDESSIIDLIKRKKIGGYATDVLSNEIEFSDKNSVKNNLIKLSETYKNILITPHIGGATHDAMWLTEDFCINKLISIF